MGLREQNAARTRQHISDTATELFGELGYDATTMEAVAQRADIGSSTLYRYFPNKESLAIAPLGEPGAMARAFRNHGDLPVEEALGEAVVDLAEGVERHTPAAVLFQSLVAQHVGPRAQMMEWFTTEHQLLATAVAERLGLTVDHPEVTTRTWMAVYVLWQASAIADGSSDEPIEPLEPRSLIARVIDGLSQLEIRAPRLNPDP